MDNLLDRLKLPQDLKKLSFRQLEALCAEIRSVLIHTVSKTGGHLSSNLGVVELTVALHKTFDAPKDQIVWDVGHQSYTHKILTGRKNKMNTLRQKGGLSGFPKPAESIYDAFIAGHSSTSISVAAGLARAKSLKAEPGFTIAVIGDGAFTGGMAYEALNNAGHYKDRIIIVLNDNEMSISKNVGAFARYLAQIRSKPEYYSTRDKIRKWISAVPLVGKPMAKLVSDSKSYLKEMLYHSNLFEDFGFEYVGPVDGHDLESLCDAFERAKASDGPVLVHVDTIKGKGYSFAEKQPDAYHGVPQFNAKLGSCENRPQDFSAVFGSWIAEAAEKDAKICAITAAMKDGTGLEEFAARYPERFYDVGIAESHAVTFSAGLAHGGLHPVFAVYSTFLQRAYDQVMQDMAIANEHVLLAVDRAGIVGEDGETHQGIFDISFLSSIPGITILSPATYPELRACLDRAMYRCTGPVAVRYPKGREKAFPAGLHGNEKFQLSKDVDTLLISYGRLAVSCCQAAELLRQKGVDVGVLKLTQLLPYCEELLPMFLKKKSIFFVEEAIEQGSISQMTGNLLLQNGYQGKFFVRAVPNRFLAQASVDEIFEELGWTPQMLAAWVEESIG
ncbi:MAG: 1-deoxy-D-xylulose-5-phosphate synthase [Oscillospiraceae bacterium]|nr:1-deoxy-D-xylulose-5-phosphate synthase [Oscillospiraceae bacterium]MDD7040699.1 1-deoxy-D-xylulose-5-phosphate synthase [Oscillospiraceae bacterium]MDY2611438.1 1-deoxy-D-xylulose-5-phosphate synthase [Oscillospiraceae bacterium]